MLKLVLTLCLLSFPAAARYVPLNGMQRFSGLSRDEILQKRKAAMFQSTVFGGRSGYAPSAAVFQIDDGAPWIGAYQIACVGVGDTRDIGAGLSRESVGILNPELLFYINVPSYAFQSRGVPCSDDDYLIPYRVDYDSLRKRITARVGYSPLHRKTGRYDSVVLQDANARDLGYNYAFAAVADNVRFKNDSNLSNRIVQTSGFYHRGFSCGAPEGCNNYSPYETGYHLYLTDLPAELTVKLWKEYPRSENDPADMTYRMIFD
ncbi:MAG TPA: hypothetical protein DCX19_02630 [Alphaproteobacteria bacterium]|nr:hypothetical protein [Alphaproteobacteria bacterium]